jgi:hypothetical protein
VASGEAEQDGVGAALYTSVEVLLGPIFVETPAPLTEIFRDFPQFSSRMPREYISAIATSVC